MINNECSLIACCLSGIISLPRASIHVIPIVPCEVGATVILILRVRRLRSEVPCAWSCSKRYRARFRPRQSGSRDILLTTVPHDFSMCNLSSHNTLEDNVLDILRIRKSKLSNLPEELIPKYLPSLPPTVVTLKDSSAMGPRAMTGIRGC